MKNIYTKIGILVVLIVVLILLIRLIPSKQEDSSDVASSTPSTVDTTTTSAKTSQTAVTGTKTTAKPAASPTNYNAYVTQYRNSENTCATAALAKYKQIYVPNLETSSFTSYYNAKTGACFMKVTGASRAPYSATTTAHIYFRNNSTNVALAECTNTNGTSLDNKSWQCVNSVTKQSLNLGQFDEYVTATVTK